MIILDATISGSHLIAFRRIGFRFSARRPAVLTKIFCGLSQSLQVDVVSFHKIGHDSFLPHPLQFINPPLIQH